MKEYHSSPIGGHSGITRTSARISAQFFWSTLKKDVTQYVKACLICQQAKTLNTPPAGLLQPLPIPDLVWEDIAMDFITGLPSSHGYTVIMVVIDRLSKYAHFVPMKSDYTSSSVAESFMQNIAKLHGIPKSIVSDRDKVFTSAFWKHLFKLQGTTLAMTSAYHPQSDGQTENLNKSLEMYLRCFTFENPKTWFKMLCWAEFWYNSSFHTGLGVTPFKALYGRDPPALFRPETTNSDPADVVTQLKERDRLLQQLKMNLQRAQDRMKKHADKKRSDVQLQVGDLVLVKLQPYRQHSVALRKNQKLSMRYFGPFEVIEKIGSVAYKLKLPDTAKIHAVFHVSQLKQFKGDTAVPYLPLPLISNELGPVVLPKSVLKARIIQQGQRRAQQVLILWDDEDISKATWEDVDKFKVNYPSFNLEDKIVVEGEGIVMKSDVASAESATNEVDKIANDAGIRRSTRAKRESTMLKGFVRN